MNPLAMWHGAQAATPDMKQPRESSISFSRSDDPHRRQARRWSLALLASLAAVSTGAHAEAYLPSVGGGGGGQFKAPCAEGQLLAGFELRVGDDVDAIRPVCAIATGPQQISLQPVAGWYGGTGGRTEPLMCPSSTPVVTGLYVAAEGETTVIVNTIHLYCGLASDTQAPAGEYPSAVFNGPTIKGVKFSFPAYVGKENHFRGARHDCPSGQVAVGVHGRYGVWLDEVGLICDEPVVPEQPVALGRVPDTKPLALGRVKTRAKPALETTVNVLAVPAARTEQAIKASETPRRVVVDPPICTSARQARARNSPAAPGLEEQCRAAGGTP
jgi:hypothetical protein